MQVFTVKAFTKIKFSFVTKAMIQQEIWRNVQIVDPYQRYFNMHIDVWDQWDAYKVIGYEFSVHPSSAYMSHSIFIDKSVEIKVVLASGWSAQPRNFNTQSKSSQNLPNLSSDVPTRSKQVKFCTLKSFKSQVKFCYKTTKSSWHEVKKDWGFLRSLMN